MAQSRRTTWLKRDAAAWVSAQGRSAENGSDGKVTARIPWQRRDSDAYPSAPVDTGLEPAEAATLVAHERERVARDLHEIIMARLLRVGFDLSALEERIDESAAARIREIVAEVDEVWSDTRRLAFDLLSTRAVEFGLVERLQVIVEDGAARVGCEPRLVVTGPADALPEEMSHQLRAVAREAVLNVVLHAGASRFAVELDVGDAATELRVLDDGVGISKTQASGLGLRNLAARAADLEGTFGTAAAEGGGTVLRWAVPVCAQA